MKIVKLHDNMLPLVYLVRRWGKWYYVDQAGYYLSMEETNKKLEAQDANT